MDSSKFAERIAEALYLQDDENEAGEIDNILTFAEAGVMTADQGLVVKMTDGSEFQVTVVQSR